jgi:hypothetical protein
MLFLAPVISVTYFSDRFDEEDEEDGQSRRIEDRGLERRRRDSN